MKTKEKIYEKLAEVITITLPTVPVNQQLTDEQKKTILDACVELIKTL